MKFQVYLLVSLSLAAAVIARAFALRPNFWSASILLASSNGSLILLTNLALIITGGFVWGLQRLLYGTLRPIEVEQLYEKGWMAVTETLLSLTIFREDIGVRFFIMFLTLMAGKVWIWIGEGRVEFLEQQPPANPTLFHSRLSASLFLSVLFDCSMFSYCLRVVLREARPGMMVMFGFEYTILSIQSVSILIRYGLILAEYLIRKRQTKQLIEARRAEIRQEREAARAGGDEADTNAPQTESQEGEIEVDENEIDVPGWEDKGRWVFYLDLATDFVKSLVYCGFFVILLVFHGLPIHIMRDLYITVRSFCKRILDFVQYRQATKNMNERYSDATEQDLQADNTCIICREEMHPWNPRREGEPAPTHRTTSDERQRAKKLPCGHILHFNCLRSWLERQRVCPTCRRPVLLSSTPTNDPNGQNRPNQRNGLNLNAQAHGAQVQPNQGQGAAAGAANPNNPPNRPNMRVFNLGPIRIALGGGVVNNQDAGRANPQAQPMPAPAQQAQDNAERPRSTMEGITSMGARSSIQLASLQLRTQQLQLEAIRQFGQINLANAQLGNVARLLDEMEHLQQQQAGGLRDVPAPPGSGSGSLATRVLGQFHPRPGEPPVLGGDASLPPGMVLPPGYTLQRLHPVGSQGNGSAVPENDAEAAGPSTAPQTAPAPTAEAGGA